MKAEASYQTVTRQRLYEQVAAQIERMIRDGELAEGEALPAERELLERFSVGRITIREALLSLQQKGLIQISNGERARVTRPNAASLIGSLTGAAQVYLADEKGVHDFQGLRHLIEIAMARLAATQATASDLDRIGEALNANNQARGNPERFSETDVAFHLTIAEVSRNPLVTGGYRALNGWLAEQRLRVLAHDPSDDAAYEAHARIYAAIRTGDPDRAEAEMRGHLETITGQYWAAHEAARSEHR